jgi:hypothetical protein
MLCALVGIMKRLKLMFIMFKIICNCHHTWYNFCQNTVSGSIPGGSQGILSVVTDRTMCPGVDSAPKNEYQGFILG